MRPPLRCALGGIGPRGRSAGTPRAAVHAGHRPPAGVPRPMPPAVHTGPQPSRAFRRPPAARGASALAGVPRPTPPAAHAGHRPPRGFRRSPAARRHTRGLGPRGRSAGLPQAAAMRGASVLAGVPQASRRPSPCAGHRPLAGVPRAAVHEGPRPSRAFRGPRRPPPTRGIGPRRHSAGLPQAAAHAGPQPSQAFRTPPAARARSQPAPAARFSRKPPCGIGSRMVYCT